MLQISRFLFTARKDKGNLFWYYIFARLNLVFIFTEHRKNMSVFFETQTARKDFLFYYTLQIFLLQREIKSPTKH